MEIYNTIDYKYNVYYNKINGNILGLCIKFIKLII